MGGSTAIPVPISFIVGIRQHRDLARNGYAAGLACVTLGVVPLEALFELIPAKFFHGIRF